MKCTHFHPFRRLTKAQTALVLCSLPKQRESRSCYTCYAHTQEICGYLSAEIFTLQARAYNFNSPVCTNRSRNSFSVQKPFGSSKIGHRSERFCVFLPIFAGWDGEGNEQKLGEEWGQAKQWKFVLKNPSVNGRSHLVDTNAFFRFL